MKPKTVIIWDSCGKDPIQFCVVDGDYRELNDVYINAMEDEDLIDKIDDLIARSALSIEFPTQAVKDGAYVIVAGLLPQ